MATANDYIESIIYQLNQIKNSRHRDRLEEEFKEQLKQIDTDISDILDYLEEKEF